MNELFNFPQVQQVPVFFKKLVDEQVTRLQSFSDEAAKFEAKLLENLALAVDESAKQVKAGLTQVANLTAEYRRLSLETTQKLAGFLTPRA
jgi:hypothetical protein